MAAIESNILKKRAAKGQDTEMDMPDLSECQLVYFGYNDESVGKLGFTSAGAYYNVGGDDWRSAAIITRGTAPVLEQSVPYPKSEQDIYSPKTSYTLSHRVANIFHLGLNGNKEVQVSGDVSHRGDIVKQAIMDYGAVSIGYRAGADSDNDENLLSGDAFFFSSRQADYERFTTNHAVTIVGWDDDYSYSNFKGGHNNEPPTINGAWIVRNSWGTDYADNGYFYMSYQEITLCDGIVYDIDPTLDLLSSRYIYKYDMLGLVDWMGYGSNKAKFANVFTSEEGRDEVLYAASFYAPAPILSYTVSVYQSPKNGPIGELKMQETKNFTEGALPPGWHI